MIFITGRGRSGTTFMMKLFTDLGFDTPVTQNKNPEHGLEGEVKGLAMDIDSRLKLNTVNNEDYTLDKFKRIVNFPNSDLINQVKSFKDYDVLKSPHAQFVLHVWLENLPIDTVIVCNRDIDVLYQQHKENGDNAAVESEDSFLRNTFIGAGIRDWACDKYDVERIPVHYPTSVMDKEYLYNKLSSMIDDKEKFMEVHDRIARPDRIRNPERCKTE